MTERRFNPENMARLDNPERRKALPPEKILPLLNITESDTVLDLGAGTGYFTIPIAKMTAKTVYALDVAPQMLNVIQERVQEQQLENVRLVEGEIENIPLDANLVDCVMASMVLHEVESLSQGIKEIHRLLKPGGLCLCLEWEKEEMEQGPPLNHRVHSDDMKKAFVESGFTIVDTVFLSDAYYIMVARK